MHHHNTAPQVLSLLSLLSTAACAAMQGQEILADYETTKVHTSLPLINQNRLPLDWFHCVNITVGTPPQNFRAVVDIGWTDLMLPSPECDSESSTSYFCSYVWNMYNSSASTTNEIDHGPFADLETAHYTLRWFGTKNRDVVDIGGIRLKAQDFLSANQVNALGMLDFWDFDAVLGLPRYPDECERKPWHRPVCEPGPFHTMVNGNMLDRNVYGLLLSNVSAANYTPGSLDLGFVDEDRYKGDLMTFPVSDLPRQVETTFPSGWHVDFHEFSFGSDVFPMPGYQAVFYTIEPFIYLPRNAYKALAHRIAPGEELEGFLLVDCDMRNEMPDFHFVLGPDRLNVTLTPWQYIFADDPGRGNETRPCVAPFLSNEFGPLDGDDTDVIGLGSTFLRNFYSVFDVDDNTISLGWLG